MLEPRILARASTSDMLARFFGLAAAALRFCRECLGREVPDGYPHINTISNRSGNLAAVFFHDVWHALARLGAQESARTGVERCDEHEICRKGGGAFGARNTYHAVFERLPQRAEGTPAALSVRSGRIETAARASRVFPVPGGP